MALHSTLGPGFNALLPGLLPDVGQYGWKLCSIISCHEREGLGHPVWGHFAKCKACLQVHCVVALPFMLGLNKVMRDDGIT
jgi:hypothetical protein